MGRVRNRNGALAACVLAAWALACATPGSTLEDEDRLRRARSHLDLGIDYLRNDRAALGLRELLIAEEFDPDDPRIQYALADAYLMKGKPAEAEQHYRRVLELEPDYHEARLNLSALYLEQERYEDSYAESARLADDPTFPAVWRALANRGWAELRLGRRAEARATLQRAREFRPDYWPTLLNLGILEMEEGRKLEAVALFQQVLEQRPGPGPQAEANYRIGEIYVSLGKRERAMGYLMAAVAESPNGPWGTKSEEYLRLLR